MSLSSNTCGSPFEKRKLGLRVWDRKNFCIWYKWCWFSVSSLRTSHVTWNHGFCFYFHVIPQGLFLSMTWFNQNCEYTMENDAVGVGLAREFGNQHHLCFWLCHPLQNSELSSRLLRGQHDWHPLQDWSQLDRLPWVIPYFPGAADNSCISSTK